MHYDVFFKILYGRGGQLFSSAGHIAPLLASRGANFSQKGKVKAKKLASAGHIVTLLVSRGANFSQKGKVKAKKLASAGRMLPPPAIWFC